MASPNSASASESSNGAGPGSADGHPFISDDAPANAADSVPVETLVEHLLAAKRALSSMTAVLRANDLSTHARLIQEESSVLAARANYLRRAMINQVASLLRVRDGLSVTYNQGRRDFDKLVKTLDTAGDKLARTMEMLRSTNVDAVFRPPGEEPKNLLDFVDETSVDVVMKQLMDGIAELKNAEISYDGDLLHFDNDMRTIKAFVTATKKPRTPAEAEMWDPIIPFLVSSLERRSHLMAQHLTSLTRHFDLCVVSVRTSEGGAALALRKAAEETSSASPSSSQRRAKDPISISGVISGQNPDDISDLAPMSAQDRADMINVVVQDAAEVDAVVGDINKGLQDMEATFANLMNMANAVRYEYLSTVQGYQAMLNLESHAHSYVAAEREYLDRVEQEKSVIAARLAEVEEINRFYENYASAYSGLLIEYERRRSVQDKIQAIWRKAGESVERLVEQDRTARRNLQLELGEHIPTDLWVGMNDPIPRWKVMQTFNEIAESSASSPSFPPRPFKSGAAQDRASAAGSLKEKHPEQAP